MRNYLLVMTLAIWPAANASAQFGENPAGEQPRQIRQENDERRDRMGPPPNVMFQAIDVDGDGIITKAELRKAVASLKKLDTDGDGNIALAEVTAPSPWSDPAQFIDRMLTENDENGDGKLAADELPERMQQMLQEADTNGDGALDREELTAAMENMRTRFRGGPGRGVRGGDRAGNATAQFMRYDSNGDGRLTREEVPAQALGALQGGDLNNDGAIDPAELQAIIARLGDAARGVAEGAAPGGDPNTFRDPNRRNRPRGGPEN